ncbi:MAG: tRNA (adenosine(37)-N6)-threonylcarbamoyltransferase complex ATPase subunit type 1 TsaE, partial [Firmicutes bacterium]|nr:tRNA (adenosine(37)-N6)-threonylcarbamoyltransferase complex ATPase subunit type 1 TsaE [Bacillota bacterium]
EYFFGDGITLVEWPERMGDLIPEQYLKITLGKVEDFNQREIMIELVGNRYKPYEEVLSKYDSISY